MSARVHGIVCGQGSADVELALAAELQDWVAAAGPDDALTVFRGMSLSGADVIPAHPSVRVISSGLLGSNAEIWKRRQLDLVPEPVSRFPALIRAGAVRCESVVVSATAVAGGFRVGVVSDYLPAALETATRVIVESRRDMPVLDGAPLIPRERVDRVVDGEATPMVFDTGGDLPEDAEVGRLAATLVRDGDCIEIGVGGLGRAVARSLAAQRRNLSVHTGLINDDVLALIDSGAVTNAGNAVAPGRSSTPVAMGSRDFYRRLAGRRDIVLRPVDVTNDPATIGAIDNFVAINSAVEVDLLGQVNAEVAGGRRIGAQGGQMDFVSGARLSRGGRSVAILRSTARAGALSRIVARLDAAVVTVPAGTVDYVVSEYGVAELRGATTEQRARRIAAIAHPDFRAGLAAAWTDDPRVTLEAR